MPRARRSNRHAPAHTAFFLLACGQAALAVPLWLAERQGWLAARAPSAPSLFHAHEMLLGYAVAVIGGFLFTRLSWPALAGAGAAWLAGRAAATTDAAGWLPALAALAFPAGLAGLAGWPFVKSARSGRNLVFAPILIGFPLAEALYQGGRLGLLAAGEQRGVLLALDLVVTLLLVMGGRILPAAMAGIMRSRGDAMTERNGPLLERITTLAMTWAALFHMANLAALGAAGWMLAGAASLLRLSRWRFRASLGVPSLWPLQVGYGCLAGGLVGTALASWTPLWPASAVLHAATIGGLGVISATMMVRTVSLRARMSSGYPRQAMVVTALLLAAAGGRVAAPLSPQVLIPLSALAWSAAFALIGAWLLTMIKQ